MLKRTAFLMLLTISALALPAAVSAAAGSGGALVFSRVLTTAQGTSGEGTSTPKAAELEGGLFAARNGGLNQLTENPADTQPDFSSDGRLIAFARDGDIWAMRPDGSGQHPLTSGPEVDAGPQFAPNGHYVVFERRAAAGEPRDLYTVDIAAEGLHALTSTAGRRAPGDLLARRACDRLRHRRRARRRRRRRRHLLGAALRGGPGPAHPHRQGRRVLAALLRRRDRLQPRPERHRPGRLRRRLHDASQRDQGQARRRAGSARPPSRTSRPTGTCSCFAATRASG